MLGVGRWLWGCRGEEGTRDWPLATGEEGEAMGNR